MKAVVGRFCIIPGTPYPGTRSLFTDPSYTVGIFPQILLPAMTPLSFINTPRKCLLIFSSPNAPEKGICPEFAWH